MPTPYVIPLGFIRAVFLCRGFFHNFVLYCKKIGFQETEVLRLMGEQTLCIVFSLLLLPVNFCCSFWLFSEALKLCEMTFPELLQRYNSKGLYISGTGHRTRGSRIKQRQRLIAEFFREHSSDPRMSVRLTKCFGYCTLLGLAALCLALYAALDSGKSTLVFTMDAVLLCINIAIAVCGRRYAKNNPLDAAAVGKIKPKRKQDGKYRVKYVIVYTLVGALLFGFLLFFMVGIASITRTDHGSESDPVNGTATDHGGESHASAIFVRAELISLLENRGYETSNIGTTYWELDQDKLEHVAAGVKEDSRFEFYGYSDDASVESVYSRIVSLAFPALDASEREKHETVLGDGSKMLTVEADGVYYLVMYRNDTVIYAFSRASLSEINEILTEVGYLNDR